MILIGGMAVTEAGPRVNATASTAGAPALQSAGASEGAPAQTTADGRLEIQAVAAATGKPLEGAAVDWSLRINNGRYKKTGSSTGGDGRAVLEWPKWATVNGIQVTVRKAGFVPYVIRLDDNIRPVHLPAVKVLRLVPGITIGGVVQDEAGKPVAGAKITVYAPPAESGISHYRFDLADLISDAQGRWKVDAAPVDLAGVNIQISATGFLSTSGTVVRGLDTVTVLKRGFTVRGRVVDSQGKPVANANVRCGDIFGSNSKPAKTNAHGEFVLENCPPGASTVTVLAEGSAPEIGEIHPEDQPTLEFVVGPGHVLRGKIVDRQGKPVAGATVAADTWRNHRSLDFRVNADKDGRFEWRAAPSDVVLYDVFTTGYMSRRRVALSPNDSERVVTLDPVLVISGRVTDAVSGRPVPAFRIVRGLVFANNPRVSWLARDAAEFTGGHYTIRHSEPYAGYAVRVEADGYKPADSRVLAPGEIAPTFDFALTHAEAADLLTGIVLHPDGEPEAGVEVALATPEHPLIFEMEQFRFGRGNGMSFAKTGPDGRFSIGKPGGPYRLAAMSDYGYGEATQEGFAKSDTLVLEAWGKIKGEARIGRLPAANQTISFARRQSPTNQPGAAAVYAFDSIETRTDAQGRFVFDRVIPGASEVSRVVVTDFGNGSQQHMGCWQEPVDVAPGQTVAVKIGGKGRAVVGRIKLQTAPGVRFDWRQNRPATIEKLRVLLPGLFNADPRQNDRFAGSLDKDGRFRVEDVPPGHYELTVTIDGPPRETGPGQSRNSAGCGCLWMYLRETAMRRSISARSRLRSRANELRGLYGANRRNASRTKFAACAAFADRDVAAGSMTKPTAHRCDA